jgi:hypothetical protein
VGRHNVLGLREQRVFDEEHVESGLELANCDAG